MRFLDEQLANRLAFPVTDLATPLKKFCGLPFSNNTILIVENEMTFSRLEHPPQGTLFSAFRDTDCPLQLEPEQEQPSNPIQGKFTHFGQIHLPHPAQQQ